MTTLPRRIAHLDMDAFYASVELLRYPQLRGLPVVIGGRSDHRPVMQADGSLQFSRLRDYVGRGVVTTSTYEARALGVFSAMGMMKAAQLAPDTICFLLILMHIAIILICSKPQWPQLRLRSKILASMKSISISVYCLKIA